ncbi:MAG TPA: thermonuclease family protein [Cyclobacteriaceae bacterium]|nr:thermonuclease family protein [Cyclobacteriaceae bacterium]
MIRIAFLLFVYLFNPTEYYGKVTAVLDGDTIEVLKEGRAVRIRLNGIDAPEKDQPYGMKSKMFVSDFIYGKTVKIVEKEKDRYGRMIADVYTTPVNDTSDYSAWVNQVMIGAGLAWHYKRYSSDEKLANAEITARKLKLGLWAEANPTPPWDWRRKDD